LSSTTDTSITDNADGEAEIELAGALLHFRPQSEIDLPSGKTS
jgi:hypothetical protein